MSIPGPDGVIHGCYKTGNPNQGSLLAIDSGASPPSGYTGLNWGQAGSIGPGLTNVHTTSHRFTIDPLSVNANPQPCRVGAVSGQFVLTVGWSFAYGPNGENPVVLPLITNTPDTVVTYSDNWTLSFYGGDAAQDVVLFAVRANVPAA